METLKDFSENQKNYLLYQSRIDAQLERNTWKQMMKEAEQQRKNADKQRKNAEQQLKTTLIKLEYEQQEKEKALKEKEQYLKIMKEKGIAIETLLPEQKS